MEINLCLHTYVLLLLQWWLAVQDDAHMFGQSCIPSYPIAARMASEISCAAHLCACFCSTGLLSHDGPDAHLLRCIEVLC